jgi:hypothetical protein
VGGEGSQDWIWVNRWEEFQSFQVKRGKPWAPPWIRLYPQLLGDDDFLALTESEQLLLLKLFMLFSSQRQVVANDTRSLSRRCGQRVLKRHVDSLNHAGYIDLCSRTVLERRRNAFWNGSILEVEVDIEGDKNQERSVLVIGEAENVETTNGSHPTRRLEDMPL